jgi:hypothetical protein
MNTTPAQITVLTKLARSGDPAGALLSKRITLGLDGKPSSDGSACRMASGTAVTVAVADAAALGSLIDGLRECDALALGSVDGALGVQLNVVTADVLARVPPAQHGSTVISRTREYIVFRPGEPAWCLLDFDRKGMPAQVQAQLDAMGGFWAALLRVVSGLEHAARVARASTSSGLCNSATGECFPDSGGIHTYVLVQDGADIDRALQALHDRCWLHGLGWFLISSAGSLLPRSIVDAAVRGPERLVFERKPEVVLPLVQDAAARACAASVGAAIDSRVVICDLTSDEKQAVDAFKAAQRVALEPQALPIRVAADQRLVEAIVKRMGMPRAAAMRQVAARHRGILLPDITLTTDHHGTVTVRQILADPQKYVGETLCDPLEGPQYGHDKAKIMRSKQNLERLFVHSFAHGGATYDLKHDANSAEAALKAAPVNQLGDVLCEVADNADLEEDEIRRLLQVCAERAPKIGLQAFTRRLKRDRERRAQEKRRAAAKARQAASAFDTRQRRRLPPGGRRGHPGHARYRPRARRRRQRAAADAEAGWRAGGGPHATADRSAPARRRQCQSAVCQGRRRAVAAAPGTAPGVADHDHRQPADRAVFYLGKGRRERKFFIQRRAGRGVYRCVYAARSRGVGTAARL